ncbi:MAG: DUF177 domain-containing protein [Proteobacteria bacterium]|nr:DUF177 domain-containing protein [Pseudomonadota bacterium]
MPRFVFQLKDIHEAGRNYLYTLDRSWLTEALSDCPLEVDREGAPGQVQLRLQRDGADVLVTGSVRATLRAECSRCLGPAPLNVDAAVGALLTARGPAFRPEPDELELTPEELDRSFYTGSTIVLDGLIREQLILELPMQPLCSQDCPGIAVPDRLRPPPGVFGEPCEVDPRLAPLKALGAKADDKE